MIRTKKQVLIDAQNGIYGTVYLQAMNPNFIDENDIVQVDVQGFILQSQTVKELVPNGSGVLEETNVVKNSFRQVIGFKGMYKRSTWDSVFAGVSKTQYDQKLIESIAFVNEREVNNGWTGKEIQRISYWAKPMTFDGVDLGGITGHDLEIVTPEMIQSLIA